MVRIQRIGIVRIAQSERPRQRSRHLPGVLRVEIQIQEIVRLRIGERKGFRGCRRDAVDELRQRRICDQRNRAFAEIIIVQPEDPGVGAEPQFVRADGPRQIVVDEEARRAPPCTHVLSRPPSVVNGALAPLPCKHDRKAASVF